MDSNFVTISMLCEFLEASLIDPVGGEASFTVRVSKTIKNKHGDFVVVTTDYNIVMRDKFRVNLLKKVRRGELLWIQGEHKRRQSDGKDYVYVDLKGKLLKVNGTKTSYKEQVCA